MSTPATPSPSAGPETSSGHEAAGAPEPSPEHPSRTPATTGGRPAEPARRPLLERLGLAAIALLLAALFGGVAVAALAGGELFLAAMGAIGALMTVWAGAVTLFRG